jgi:hypothetical protein
MLAPSEPLAHPRDLGTDNFRLGRRRQPLASSSVRPRVWGTAKSSRSMRATSVSETTAASSSAISFTPPHKLRHRPTFRCEAQLYRTTHAPHDFACSRGHGATRAIPADPRGDRRAAPEAETDVERRDRPGARGLDQERCVWMAALRFPQGPMEKGGQPSVGLSRKCQTFTCCLGRHPVVRFISGTWVSKASGKCR